MEKELSRVTWIKTLDKSDLCLLEALITADFKINQCAQITGESYFLIKKRLDNLKNHIKQQSTKSELKEYLDFLVDQNALITSIAEVIYKKHLDELGE